MLRRLSDRDYYQVLEVPYDASATEIQSAYEEAREIYGHDALVSGSILSEHERRRTFEQIAEAYQTLIAEESRRLYDENLGLSSQRRMHLVLDPVRERCAEPTTESSSSRARSDAVQPAGVALVDVEQSGASGEAQVAPGVTLSESSTGPAAVAEPAGEPRKCPLELGMTEEASGEFLKRAREAMGLDLAVISEETKIGVSMLGYIEDERLDRLPAPVYLRNFTLQVARCLGLDEHKISRTYLARIRRLQGQT